MSEKHFSGRTAHAEVMSATTSSDAKPPLSARRQNDGGICPRRPHLPYRQSARMPNSSVHRRDRCAPRRRTAAAVSVPHGCPRRAAGPYPCGVDFDQRNTLRYWLRPGDRQSTQAAAVRGAERKSFISYRHVILLQVILNCFHTGHI